MQVNNNQIYLIRNLCMDQFMQGDFDKMFDESADEDELDSTRNCSFNWNGSIFLFYAYNCAYFLNQNMSYKMDSKRINLSF